MQVAVETEYHLIVTHEVTNVGNDCAQLAPMAKAAKETLAAETLDVIADRGYFDSEQIKVNLEHILRKIQTYSNDLHDILLHRS